MIAKRMEMPKIMKVDTLTDVYGKFIAEPLERGYGQTVGTALRRVLLSSITTAAVTSIKIENVLHEFGTIKGVEEDVTQIILNVKQIKLKLSGSVPEKMLLNKSGQMTVTAGDITADTGVEIVNPDLVIANLTSASSKLVIEFKVGTGRGYVVSEDNKKEGDAIGVIPVDSVIYSLSSNGKKYHSINENGNKVTKKTDHPIIQEFSQIFPETPARFIRIRAKNAGVCPPWHEGAGQACWMFADEIVVY